MVYCKKCQDWHTGQPCKSKEDVEWERRNRQEEEDQALANAAVIAAICCII